MQFCSRRGLRNPPSDCIQLRLQPQFVLAELPLIVVAADTATKYQDINFGIF